MSMFQYSLTGMIFAVCAMTDIRQKIIAKKAVGIYFILALLGHGIDGMVSIGEILSGIIPGIACILLSRLSREAFGYGDSMLILGCGISLGMGPCMEVVVWAFFFSGIWSLLLLVLRRANRTSEIPFVPFLLMGLGVAVLG